MLQNVKEYRRAKQSCTVLKCVESVVECFGVLQSAAKCCRPLNGSTEHCKASQNVAEYYRIVIEYGRLLKTAV